MRSRTSSRGSLLPDDNTDGCDSLAHITGTTPSSSICIESHLSLSGEGSNNVADHINNTSAATAAELKSSMEVITAQEELEQLRRRVRELERKNEHLTQQFQHFSHTNSASSPSHSPLSSSSNKRPMSPRHSNNHNPSNSSTSAAAAFLEALKDRSSWLVALLIFQSCSSFILARNDALLQRHPVIVHFLTMLVGAGGNAGNQASVRVIRGLAVGTLHEKTLRNFFKSEFKMACALTLILSTAGFVRAALFARTPPAESIAVTSSLALIVFTSICFGAVLPFVLRRCGFDPAHSSTTIQVIMDILGVWLTVCVSSVLLPS